MLLSTKTEHIYARLKDCVKNEEGVDEIFLFSGLTISTEFIKTTKREKKVTAVVSKIYEDEVENAPLQYLQLKNEDIRIIVDENEFERLIKLSEEDLPSFFLYDTQQTL